MFSSDLKVIKGPLGVVGLFITLIYAIYGYVLKDSLSQLHICLQSMLILFLIGYPILLLHVFFKLVTKHPGKIYGPQDFRTDEGFNTYKKGSLLENMEDFDPSLSNTGASSNPPTVRARANAVAQFIGKEYLAQALLSEYLKDTYGYENVREDFARRSVQLDSGYDFVVSKPNSKDRIHIEVKLISDKSQIDNVLAKADQSRQLVDMMEMGGTRNRDYLLFLVADGTPAIVSAIKNKISETLQTSKYHVRYEFKSLEELEDKYLEDVANN
ncbi:MAG TPA: hypothetical protein VEF76_07190 [Patescibacteria group bacterium]|nr:hypothetical protein [Patescibacteria group bacterium]